MISVSSLHPASGPSEQRMPGGTISPSILFLISNLMANITLYVCMYKVGLNLIWMLSDLWIYFLILIFFQYFGFYMMKVSTFDRSLTQLRGFFDLCVVSACENFETPLLSFCKLLAGISFNDPAIPTKRSPPHQIFAPSLGPLGLATMHDKNAAQQTCICLGRWERMRRTKNHIQTL